MLMEPNQKIGVKTLIDTAVFWGQESEGKPPWCEDEKVFSSACPYEYYIGLHLKIVNKES